jgi:hypothetical protein
MHKLFAWLLRDRQSQTAQLIKENQQLKQQLATKLDITLNDVIKLVEEIRTFNAGAVDKPLDKHIDAVLDSWMAKYKKGRIYAGRSKLKTVKGELT